MKFHMLFEQSGTFKNVFKSYGHEAYDYDILDDYGHTDFKIDLFKEIETAYQLITQHDLKQFEDRAENTGWSLQVAYNYNIFFKMKPDTDMILAFFPCTYFAEANELLFKRWVGGKKMPLDQKSAEYIIKRNKERAYYFELYTKLCFICTELKIPTIIENPSGNGRSYLIPYSAVNVAYEEKDRTKFGDIFKKPTLYFAINFEMKENFMMYDVEYNTQSIRNQDRSNYMTTRSKITERYADNFYKRFIQQQINNN